MAGVVSKLIEQPDERDGPPVPLQLAPNNEHLRVEVRGPAERHEAIIRVEVGMLWTTVHHCSKGFSGRYPVAVTRARTGSSGCSRRCRLRPFSRRSLPGRNRVVLVIAPFEPRAVVIVQAVDVPTHQVQHEDGRRASDALVTIEDVFLCTLMPVTQPRRDTRGRKISVLDRGPATQSRSRQPQSEAPPTPPRRTRRPRCTNTFRPMQRSVERRTRCFQE